MDPTRKGAMTEVRNYVYAGNEVTATQLSEFEPERHGATSQPSSCALRRDWRGQTQLAYQLKDHHQIVFQGDDFAGSPLHTDDSLETVLTLLGFLTLQPGDTDAEYFANYTPQQLEWCQSARCDELRLIQSDIEERLSLR